MSIFQSSVVLSSRSGALRSEGLPDMSCPPPALGFASMSTSSPSGMRSVESCAATGSEPDEASGDVSSASMSACTMPLSLAVAFVAVRFPPALGDEVFTW